MDTNGWPACEIVHTVLRSLAFVVSLYFLWDIKRRVIPDAVVKFRIAWTLAIFAGAFDRPAYVSGKIYALALVDFVQLPASYFAGSFLLQHVTTNLYILGMFCSHDV